MTTALILISFRRRRRAATATFSLPEAAGLSRSLSSARFLRYRGRLAQPAARQWAHEPRVEITLSLMTPYLAFWVPEHLGGSGVLATVACGLYVSWNGPRLISSATRLQGIFFWNLLVYLVEGLVFLLTDLRRAR